MAENIYRLFGLDSGSNRGQTPMGDFLLRLINKNYSNLKEKYPFLRYINVFNRSNLAKHTRYNIQVYIDFIHDNSITNDRDKILIGKPEGSPSQPPLSENKTSGAQAIYTRDSITIGKVFHSEKIFGESFEYVLDSRWNRILSDNPYYVICSNFTKKDFPTFQQSPKLEKTLAEIENEIDKISHDTQKLEKKSEEFRKYYELIKNASVPKIKFDELFKQWLSNLRYCYSNDGETFNETTHFFFFNGPIYYGNGNAENILADLVIDGNVGLTISNEQEKIEAKKFLHGFRQFITQASFNLLVEYMNERLTETAVRASIAQVMARNMSHNFGSHVLSNLIGDDVYDKVKDEMVKELGFTSEWNKEVFKEDGKNHQLSYFFQYLKSRMDYLSEVTFGVSNLLTTKMMFNDVMKELDQVRILLNYISGISDFNYKFELKYNKDVLTDQNDFGVAFPSDVLGCQAFYNIIENIIRNTAKHAKNNNGKTVTFTITIKDNFAKEAGCEDIEGVDELYCVEIDNGVPEDNIDELVNGKKDEFGKIIIKGQNNRLNDSVLEGQNLRSSSLGLLEMEASAAFLRQIDLPEIESDDYTVDLDDRYYHKDSKEKIRLNILKAFAIDVKEEDRNDNGENIKVKTGRLGYRFFVQKPKEFLFVGNWDVDEMTKKKLLNRGIQIITTDEFCEAMEAEKAFVHQFLIYQEGISNKAKNFLSKDNDCKTLLPLRKLSISDQEWEDIAKLWTQAPQQDGQQNNSEKQGNKIIGNEILLQLKNWAWKKYAGNVKKGLTVDDICIKGERQLSNKYQVILIDHGEGYDKKTKLNWEDYLTNPNWKYICNNNDEKERSYPRIEEGWIENMSSRTNGKLPRFEALSKSDGNNKAIQNYIDNLGRSAEEENKYLRIELFEAYHNKVVVIDERVQKFAAESFEGDGGIISCADLHRSTNVFIPKLPPKNSSVESDDLDMIPLDPNDFGVYVKKVEDYITNNIKDSFLLIHYGILERMYGRDETTITTNLEEWAGMARRVVVTSGRGAHSLNLPKSVCFVNLSSALYAFNENRNKYLINYLLNQSRRKRNE